MTLLNIFGFTMSFVYLAAGIFLLISGNLVYFSKFQQTGLGCILMVYGIFRFYIGLKKYREKETEEDEK